MQRPLRIWVADDDDELRSTIAAALRDSGHDVTEAATGTALVELLGLAVEVGHSAPDVIVTDLRMPGMSGLGVLDALRRAKMTIPVVVVTALGDEVIRSFAARLGAAVVLRKPFRMDELTEAIRAASDAAR